MHVSGQVRDPAVLIPAIEPTQSIEVTGLTGVQMRSGPSGGVKCFAAAENRTTIAGLSSS